MLYFKYYILGLGDIFPQHVPIYFLKWRIISEKTQG